MKAIYRVTAITLIPKTDNEADSLVQAFRSNKYIMKQVVVNGAPVPTFEFAVGTAEIQIVKEAENGTVQ